MNRDGDAGFTLVEVMVALTIISLLGATLAVTLNISRKTSVTVTEAAKDIEEAVIIRRLFREALSQIAAPDEKGIEPLAGDRTALTLVAPAPRVIAQSAMTSTIFRPGPEGDGLVVSWSPVDIKNHQHVRQIVRSGRRVRFSYLSTGGAWVDGWFDKSRLPMAIRVLVEDIGGAEGVILTFPVRSIDAKQRGAT